MNIANSKALLLCMIMCFFAYSASATFQNNGDTNTTSQEIIIVNCSENLPDQLSELAQYTFDRYEAGQQGTIVIKTYVDKKSEILTINSLIVLLKDLGISEDNIVLIQEELRLKDPYFTLSVTTSRDIQ